MPRLATSVGKGTITILALRFARSLMSMPILSVLSLLALCGLRSASAAQPVASEWLWTVVASPTTDSLNDVFMVSSNDGWAVGGYPGAGPGPIIHYDGSAWSLVASPSTDTIDSIYMLSSSDGWAVGRAGQILHWDGSAWNTVPSPVNEWLTDIQMLSQRGMDCVP